MSISRSGSKERFTKAMRGLAVGLAALTLCVGTASARVLHISDSRRIVTLEEPAIQPNGRHVAVVVLRPEYAQNTYQHELWVVNVQTGAKQRLIVGDDVSVPRWSPNGKILSYLIRRGGHLQVALYGGDHRSDIVSHAPNDVIDFAWRPDGRAIAFAAYDAPSHRDYFHPGDNDYTQTARTPPVHLWLENEHGRRLHQLTHGTWTVAPTDPGGIFTSQFAWSRDDRYIYYTRVANTYEGDDEDSTIERLDVRNGKSISLTRHRRLELSPEPNEGRLAYWYPVDGNYLAENQLHVLYSGTDTIVSRALDRNIGGTIWLPDGSFLACGDDGAHGATWKIGVDGRVQELPLGGLTMVCDSYSSSTFDSGIAASVSRRGGIAFIATDARHARELYVLSSVYGVVRQLTDFNEFLDATDVGRMRQFAWSGPGGQPETGVLTYPPHANPKTRYPIVVLIHGGPGLASIDSFTWESWPLAQLIAAHGYIVFEPNYRGSDDHGNAFMLAIFRDTVAGPSSDILSGLAAVERLPNADPSRVAVCGWSYGGLLTSWLITQDHRWRAAVSGAAVNDEVDEYNNSVSNVQNAYYLGTSPYAPNGINIYREQSPITYASQVTTPTLIWSTTGDPVDPATQSYAFYRALHEHHVPVRFVEFDAATHGPDTPRMTEELTRMWIGWLDRYMKRRP
jgi:dipeptidyl aminopeptidase/acylaminoacyl peptidase